MIARDQDRECHCRLHEPLPGQDATLSDGDRKLIADVLNHGWHLVQIPDDSESPGWVFSVGMWHSLGSPELAVFGMGLNDAGNLINHIGARIRSGTAIGPG